MFRNIKLIAYAGLLGLYSSTLLAGLVVPISPGDTSTSAIIGDDCPTFSWSESVGAKGYELAVFEDLGEGPEPYEQAAFISDPVISRILPAPAFSWTPSSSSCLGQGLSYIWYVRDVNDTGQGDWSNGNLFTVDLLAADSMRDSIDEAVMTHLADEQTIKQIVSLLQSHSSIFAAGQGNTVRAATRRVAGDPAPASAAGKSTSATGEAAAAGGAVGFNPGGDSYITGGNFGIGTSAPTRQLEITGSFALPETTDAMTGVIYKGTEAFIHNYQGENTEGGNLFVGVGAGNFNMGGIGLWDGSSNTGIGTNTLSENKGGSFNTAVGSSALFNNQTGFSNTGIGVFALSKNKRGDGNIAVGSHSLVANEEGVSNTALGVQALMSVKGDNNTAIGAYAGQNISTGSQNLIIGAQIDAPSATDSNQMSIGNLIYGTQVDGAGTAVSTGNIGIGTPSPSRQLEITRSFELPDTVNASSGVIYKGNARFIHNYQAPNSEGNNFFAGKNAGNFTMQEPKGSESIDLILALSSQAGPIDSDPFDSCHRY